MQYLSITPESETQVLRLVDFAVSTNNVIFRVTVADGFGGMNTCQRTYNINVPVTNPTCSITSPSMGTTAVGASASLVATMKLPDAPVPVLNRSV